MYLDQRYEYRFIGTPKTQIGAVLLRVFWGCFFDHFFHIFMDKIRIFERCSICIKRLTHIKLKRMSVLACVNRININQLRTYNCYCQIYIGIVNVYRTYLGYMILT